MAMIGIVFKLLAMHLHLTLHPPRKIHIDRLTYSKLYHPEFTVMFQTMLYQRKSLEIYS